jgi:hypothetical protein
MVVVSAVEQMDAVASARLLAEPDAHAVATLLTPGTPTAVVRAEILASTALAPAAALPPPVHSPPCCEQPTRRHHPFMTLRGSVLA